MGFFKKLFKRKKGGTFFGNLLRGVSSTATGGILGSGSGLAKWEQKQAENEAVSGTNMLIKRQRQKIQQLSEKIGNQARPHVNKALQTDEAADVQKAFSKAWLKANVWKLLTGLLATLGTITLIYNVTKKKGGKR